MYKIQNLSKFFYISRIELQIAHCTQKAVNGVSILLKVPMFLEGSCPFIVKIKNK